MTLEDIKNDKDLVKKLTSLHRTLTSLFKEDIDNDQLTYTEKEVNIGTSHVTINEHIAYTRLKKIHNLKSLYDNWDAFKTYYKEDNILNKIGEEFIKGKLTFDDNILKEIKQYPFKKQVLYYFTKNTEVQMPDVTGTDYEMFKEKILPQLHVNAQENITRKKQLLKAIEIIKSDKSQTNLKKMWSLDNNESVLGKVDGEVGNFLNNVIAHIKAGDFKYEQNESKITIQIPISGTITNGDKKEKISSSIFSVDLENPLEYSMQVGTLDNPKMSITERIRGIRNKAIGNKIGNNNDPGFKIV